MRAPSLLALAVLFCAALARAGDDSDLSALPDMGPAPDFMLVSQDGTEVGPALLRGKVVLVTFIYTWCPDICPLLTDKLARVQDDLGASFGKDIAFVSITFDPERDTTEVLRAYAEAFDADPAGWFFLTGEVEAVREVATRYGVVTIPGVDGAIDHNLLTTLIDRRGRMRVQYLGYRFDLEELHQDLLALMAEP
jgi:protein SCO1/2